MWCQDSPVLSTSAVTRLTGLRSDGPVACRGVVQSVFRASWAAGRRFFVATSIDMCGAILPFVLELRHGELVR